MTFFSQIVEREPLEEIAEAVFSRLAPNLNPSPSSDELIQIPDAMKLLGRPRTTINNWRKEGFLKEQVINTILYFKQSDLLNSRLEISGRKK